MGRDWPVSKEVFLVNIKTPTPIPIQYAGNSVSERLAMLAKMLVFRSNSHIEIPNTVIQDAEVQLILVRSTNVIGLEEA